MVGALLSQTSTKKEKSRYVLGKLQQRREPLSQIKKPITSNPFHLNKILLSKDGPWLWFLNKKEIWKSYKLYKETPF